MLGQRVLSALVGIPLVLWLVYKGGILFNLALGMIILLGLYEYINMVRIQGFRISPVVMLGSGVLILVSFIDPEYAGLLLFVIFCAHLFSIIFGGVRPPEAALSFLGVLLVAWALGHLIPIRRFPQGFYLVLLSLIITWATDTGAYFTGRFFGRHKLSPGISPKKTVEGAIGGVIVCVAASLILGHFTRPLPFWPLFGLALCGSVLGQLGDLVESAVKRWAGVKDSGRLIPGHGGVLDRFDSLILVAPFVYYYVTMFTR